MSTTCRLNSPSDESLLSTSQCFKYPSICNWCKSFNSAQPHGTVGSLETKLLCVAHDPVSCFQIIITLQDWSLTGPPEPVASTSPSSLISMMSILSLGITLLGPLCPLGESPNPVVYLPQFLPKFHHQFSQAVTSQAKASMFV